MPLPRPVLAAALLVAAAFVAASVALFVVSHADSPWRADAVVVLAGSRHARLDKGLELVRSGVAPVLVVSRDPENRSENRFCGTRPAGFQVVCFQARPFSTRGEARAVARLAARRGWTSVDVVSSTYHLVRARLIFERCFHGALRMVGAHANPWGTPLYVVSEWAKLALALTFRRGC